jgi:hypothetical protein
VALNSDARRVLGRGAVQAQSESRVIKSGFPIEHDLAAIAGLHRLEALFECGVRQAMGDDGGDLEAALEHGGHLIPRLIHFAPVDSFDREPIEDHGIPVDGDVLGWNPEQRDFAAMRHVGEKVSERDWIAGHFQSEIEAFAHGQFLLNVGEFFPADIDRAIGAHLCGEIKAVGIQVGDDDMARAGVARHGCRHDADRTRAGDEDIFAKDIERQRGMHRVPERVEDRHHVAVQFLIVVPDVGLWKTDELGERAGTGDADAVSVFSQVAAPREAVAAMAADKMAFAADDVADAKIVHI